MRTIIYQHLKSASINLIVQHAPARFGDPLAFHSHDYGAISIKVKVIGDIVTNYNQIASQRG